MSSRTFRIALGVLIVVAAAARLVHLAVINDTPLYHLAESWRSSDMHTNLAWADRVAAGAWLDDEAFRPAFGWQERIATEETWRRWLGTTTYYQPPLYTYLLALVIRATGSPDAFRVLQALLGALNAGLVGLLGWKLSGSRAAGLIAAAMAALYAPWILYDGELLRGTLALTTALLSLLALHAAEAMGRGAGGWKRRRGWLVAGGVLGVAYVADSSIVTFLPLAFLWALLSLRGEDGVEDKEVGAGPGLAQRLRRGGPRAVGLAAGLAAALLPLAARNLAVGAPPLAVTTRAPLAFVMGNAPGAMPVGVDFAPSTAEILRSSDYRLLPTIVGTIAAHQGRLLDLAGLQWRKLVGLLSSFEVPDNPSFYYAALSSPVLAYGLRFSCVVGVGLVGLILSARRPGWGLLHLYLASVLALFLTAHVISRYRQPLLIPIFILGGAALAWAWDALRGRKTIAAAILAGSVTISLALPQGPPPGYRYYRPAEFLAAAGYLEGRGEAKAAGQEIRRAIVLSYEEHGPAEERIAMGMELASLYARHKLFPQALSALREVLEEDPDHAGALAMCGAIYHDIQQPWQALQFLLRAGKADPGNAEVHARLGFLYWYVFETPPSALAHLRKALDLQPSSPAAPRLRALIDEIRASSGAS